MDTSLQQTVDFAAPPHRVYDALIDEGQHGQFTGAPASIAPVVGGPFSCYGGNVEGVTLHLVPNKRLVQTWRAKDWPEGVYSIVCMDFAEHAEGTRLTLHHIAFPQGAKDHLEKGWHKMYWTPLETYLASNT